MGRARSQVHASAKGEYALAHVRAPLSLPPEVAAPEVTIPGVSAAAHEIANAVRAGARMAVFCDYDPDGVSAGEVLRLALAPWVDGVSYDPELPGQLLFGYANAAVGMGLDANFVDAAAAGGCKLLITVDCGSASSTAVARAQKLGMLVVVTDHHQIAADNSADYHLNPALVGPSTASGAVVAYKLALALADEFTGLTPTLLGRGAAVAAFGARSDWMDMTAAENKALAAAAENPANIPIGLSYLAKKLGYKDVEDAFLVLDELLNLPKRTPRASALWSAQVFAAESEAEAEAPAAALLALQAKSEFVLASMLSAAEDAVEHDGVRVATACVRVLEGEDFTGHAGNVAHELNVRYQQPAIVFIYAGVDANGNELWRWAARGGEGPNRDQSFTEALTEIRAASTIPSADGDVPSAGGHPRAVSGKCEASRVPVVIAAFEDWARTRPHWE